MKHLKTSIKSQPIKKGNFSENSDTKVLTIKHDINFMEFPLWFQERQAFSKEGFLFKDLEGYEYRSGYHVPTRNDLLILLYLLGKSQNQKYEPEITLTRYEILKACGLGLRQSDYKRLEEGLKRWKHVIITFQGSFYDRKEYFLMQFSIINSWKIEKESGQLTVLLSSEFLTKVKESVYFKSIRFEEIKNLKSPLATRLHEILSKSFGLSPLFEIEASKLAQKIPLRAQFPSKIIEKLMPALDRINRKTSLKIAFSHRKGNDGKTILQFLKE